MAQIALLGIRLVRLSFSVNEEFEDSNDGVDLRFAFSLSGAFDQKSNRLLVKLGVTTGEEFSASGPFHLDARMEGIFRPDEGIDEGLREQFMRTNCPAIIFPYLREVVSAVTQRAGFPPLYLPVTNFKKDDQASAEVQACGTMSSDTSAVPKKSSRRPKAH